MKFHQLRINTFLGLSLSLVVIFFAGCANQPVLKDALAKDFLIGTALNTDQIEGRNLKEAEIIAGQFNAITPENILKWEKVHPEPDRYDFAAADAFVALGQKHKMFIVGHCLVCHSQTPAWVFNNADGKPATREQLLARMKDHIFAVVGRYKGRINGWDVVNEAVTDDGTLHKNRWLEIIGPDYIDKAFEYAHQADPDAELYYNDYNMWKPGHRDGVIQLVKDLKSKGLRVDGIGMQGHWGFDYPPLDEAETAIVAYAALGDVMITEMEITVLPIANRDTGAEISQRVELRKELNPYPNGLPDEMQQKQANRYAEIFRLFHKHADKISRVTLWGVQDGNSWRNNWPVRGRTDYPLLFDRDCRPKPAVEAIIKAISARTFSNPILPGFYPDPSICRVGDDYYLVNSSFEYFPGVPIFHSKDLVHWRQIGHCLTHKSQLPLDKVKASGGIYAPTLRYYDGTFYMVTTNVNDGGNFYVTAKDPAGPWSEPVWLKDGGGMDPSLFFDDDGKVYYTRHEGGGDGCIAQQTLDVKTGKLAGPMQNIWRGTGGIWPEGPHLYKINGKYYLMIAEGGTSYDHTVTIARSDSPFGPFEPDPNNPILTHRNRPDHPIQALGHADLVETPNGWWLVCLGIRPQGGRFHHLGRETFLTPVAWKDGWPVVNGNGTLETSLPVPELKPHPYKKAPAKDDFNKDKLAFEWNFLRNPYGDDMSLTARPGYLRLNGSAITLNDQDSPAFVGRRQTDLACQFSAKLDFTPKAQNEEAGLVARQNDKHHYEIGVTLRGSKRQVLFRKVIKGKIIEPIQYIDIQPGPVILTVKAMPLFYEFSCQSADGARKVLGTALTKDLSVEEIGFDDGMCFTGVYVGMYATGNGQKCTVPADFAWFEYTVNENNVEQKSSMNNNDTQDQPALKDVFKDDFYIGAALSLNQISGNEPEAIAIVEKHFNTITPENILKWEEVHPQPNKYNFEPADRYVAFGQRHKMFVVGHTLVWFHQTPDWVFQDESGNALSREALLKRMKEHIFTVMGRYKGRIHGWDIVNEAIAADGGFRKCKWLEIIGEDYVQKAFEYARQADPSAQLYYNEYDLEKEAKRQGTIQLIRDLQSKGTRIDGVGIQGHWFLDYPQIKDIETVILALSKLGVKIMITEMDIGALPFYPVDSKLVDLASFDPEMQKKHNPYPGGLPDSVQKELADRYAAIFSLFHKHRDKISRVTFWAVHDGQSWRNYMPIIGRTDYPMLFDRHYKPKPALDAVVKTIQGEK